MNNTNLDRIIEKFLLRFNEMCEKERMDFLSRERTVNYESGSSIKKYKVVHKIRKRKNVWSIDAVSNGFWIFKRRFPLLRISRARNNSIKFSGMFTNTIQDFKIDQLEEKLNEYLIICKSQPQDVFTKS